MAKSRDEFSIARCIYKLNAPAGAINFSVRRPRSTFRLSFIGSIRFDRAKLTRDPLTGLPVIHLHSLSRHLLIGTPRNRMEWACFESFPPGLLVLATIDIPLLRGDNGQSAWNESSLWSFVLYGIQWTTTNTAAKEIHFPAFTNFGITVSVLY